MANCNYILIAEDDHEDRFILGESLNEAKATLQAVFVDNGEDVVAHLQTKEELPSLLVLDLNMPKLSGKETLRFVKSQERYKHIIVVIYSTSFNQKEIQECLALGAHEYIRKPNTFAECESVARHLCDLSAAAPINVSASA